MRRTLPLLSLLLLTPAAFPADPPKDMPKDADALLGKWDVVKVDFGDDLIDIPVADVGKAYFSFQRGGKVAKRFFDDQAETEGEYKLDSAASPKTIDLSIKGEKQKRLGLYRLDGDTLTLCVYSSTFETRPKELKADGKTYLGVITLKRAKPDKKDK